MKRNSSLFQITIMVSILTVLGKLLGFGRDAIIAAYYGATADTDAYFFANAMPGTLFPAVCSSLSIAFTSIYIKRMADENKTSGDCYAVRMLVGTSFVGILLGMVGIVIAPFLVPFIAVGFEGSQLSLAIRLTKLMMGAFVLLMLEYMLRAVLNSKKVFIVPQIAGVIYNIVIIVGIVGLGKKQKMEVLTLTTIGALAVQAVVLGVFCCKRVHFSFHLKGLFAELKQLFCLAFPVLLGNCAVQLSSIVEKALGSSLSSGSLSALSYANTLNSLVTGVFVMSISTVLYPTLTAEANVGDAEKFRKTLMNGINWLSIILIPISCITLIDANDVVTIVFARGNFSAGAVSMTSMVLMCYAVGFVFCGISEVLIKSYYAMQDMKTPMKYSTIGVICGILFSLLFVKWLGLAGIALGTTFSAVIRTVLLFRDAQKRFLESLFAGLAKSIGKQLVAGIVLVVFIVLFHSIQPIHLPILQFVADTVVGFIIYFLMLLLLGVEEVKVLLRSLKRRISHLK